MPKFKKKPVEIEAMQFTSETLDECVAFCGGEYEYRNCAAGAPFGEVIAIKTLEGTMLAVLGDWIIKGVNGEFYPCKPDIFAKSYDVSAPQPPSAPPVAAGEVKYDSSMECARQCVTNTLRDEEASWEANADLIRAHVSAEVARHQDGLRELLRRMLFAAENADETGYVTDCGFISLDKLHEEVRAAIAATNKGEA